MALYSINDSEMLLGIMMNNPKYLFNSKYKLSKNDFKPFQAHLIIYVAIYNCVNDGCDVITEVEIDQWLEKYPSEYEVFKDFNGLEWIRTVKQLAKTENIDYYYTKVRRWSLLRTYKENGYDIKEIFDESKSETEQIAKLEQLSLQDIIDKFEGIQCKIKKEFGNDNDIEETKMGEGFEEVKEQFKNTPLYGRSYLSEYFNTITRGAIKGQYSMFSSPTGVGKTTIAIASGCNMCAKELWNYSTQKFEKNKNCSNEGLLFLQFELQNVEECTPKFLSYISGVQADKITKGSYKDNEEERVDKAIEILKDSDIYVACIPNFTMKEIDELIKNYTLNYNVGYVIFDYLQAGGSINQEIARNNGTVTNEAQVLGSLSSFLKDEAKKYNINVRTMSQCNENVVTKDILDSSVVMGSRSTTFKADIASVILPPRQKELKAYEMVREKRGFNHLECTHVIHNFKSRFNSDKMNLRIFVNVDMGTGRLTDLCVFDKDLKPYNLKKTILENNT